MSDYSARWVFLAACLLVQAGLLLKLGVGVDPGSAWQVVEIAGQLLFLGSLLAVLARRWGLEPPAWADEPDWAAASMMLCPWKTPPSSTTRVFEVTFPSIRPPRARCALPLTRMFPLNRPPMLTFCARMSASTWL